MPIYHIISMFEEKFAKDFEEMVLLKSNLPIFYLFNLYIRLFMHVSRYDCVMNISGL